MQLLKKSYNICKYLAWGILLITLLFFLPVSLHAQLIEKPQVSSDSSIAIARSRYRDSIDAKQDFIDILKDVFTKGIFARLDTAREKRINEPYFAVFPVAGYVLQTGITAELASNTSFFTSKSDLGNISTVNTAFIYSQYKQILIPVESDIWLEDNKFNFIGDLRYYKYPTYTYGLGDHTSTALADLIDYNYLRVYQTAYTQLFGDFHAGFGYNLDYHWNIKDEGDNTDFRKYNETTGDSTKSSSSGLTLNLLYDSRRNSNNPQGGSAYANITLRDNFTFLGSDNNWQSLICDFRKYISLPANSNNVLAIWNLDWFTLGGKPPYLDLPSTGWDTYSNTGRGYIQGRLRGNNFFYLESEYRFELTKNGFLGGVVFSNLETISRYVNRPLGTLYPGAGAGVRIKLNKYSNTNLAIDYGFGANGSGGFFFNLGEVF